jgi:hypothetical protein
MVLLFFLKTKYLCEYLLLLLKSSKLSMKRVDIVENSREAIYYFFFRKKKLFCFKLQLGCN